MNSELAATIEAVRRARYFVSGSGLMPEDYHIAANYLFDTWAGNSPTPLSKALGAPAAAQVARSVLLLEAMGKILVWIRMAASEPAEGIALAGIYIELRHADDPSIRKWGRMPPNLSKGQQIAYILSEIAHNMPDVAAGRNQLHTLTDFAEMLREAAALRFATPCWRSAIAPGLMALTEALLAHISVTAD